MESVCSNSQDLVWDAVEAAGSTSTSDPKWQHFALVRPSHEAFPPLGGVRLLLTSISRVSPSSLIYTK